MLFALWLVTADQSVRGAPASAQELEFLIDSVMTAQMPLHHVPGAVFVLVKDGRIFFAKGYGYADLSRKQPVQADRTLFRVYSVSKALTATAAMQLVERAKLASNRDVNIYLAPARVPSTFSAPITLHDLLTHTSGLDDRYIFTRRSFDPATLLPIEVYLTRNLPPRLNAPGEVIRYSNQNYMLAGYLIEAASGEPFASYMEEHVLGPLEMLHSSFYDKPALAPDLAQGYDFTGGAYRRLHLEGQCNPAGSLIATGTDMAHFMIAHLEQGRFGDRQILKPETVREMQSSRFTLDPRLPGIGYGFWERSLNGERTIEHAGHASGFITLMCLLPEKNEGFLVCVNSNQGGPLIGAVQRAYFDRCFPFTPPRITALPAQRVGADTVPVGRYRRDSTPVSGLERLLLLARGGEEVRVSATPAGLTLNFGPRRSNYVREGPLLFREASGSDRIAFRRSGSGRWLMLWGAYGVLEKLPFYDSFHFQLSWLAGCISILLSFILLWPVLIFMRRFRNRNAAPFVSRWAFAAAAAASIINMAVISCSALILLGVVEPDFMLGTSEMPVLVKALLVMPPVAAGLTIAVLAFAILSWRRRLWGLPARLHYSAVALAGLGLAGWFEHWNMLRWWFTA